MPQETPQDGPRRPQVAPKTTPRGPQDRPDAQPERDMQPAKMPNMPKMAQDASKTPQEARPRFRKDFWKDFGKIFDRHLVYKMT